MTSYIVGLDIGGTTGRMRLKTLEGEFLGDVYGQGCSINTDGDMKSEERYRDLVLPALEKWMLKPQDCAGICIAASGIDSPELTESCHRAFLNMGFQESAILIYNDCEIFLHLSNAPCMVLVAGTGSICYGKDKNGMVVRTGGWGHILSDEGSAFHIGMSIMKHVGSHMDGREDCPVLYVDFCNQTGIRDLSRLNEFINENLMDKAVIAALAPLVSNSFETGEQAGISVVRESGELLANLVMDTGKKLGYTRDQEAYVWLWGSVLLNNGHIRRQLEDQVRDCYSRVEFKVPERSALDIAVEVAKSYIKRV